MRKKYKVSAVNESEIFTFRKNDYGEYEISDGIDVTLFQVLADKLNFEYEILPPEDGQWGSPTGDGNWTGIIGMVSKTKADIGIDALSVSYQLAQVVNFSYPYFIDKTAFSMRAPALLSKDLVFVYPFHFMVWLFIGISILLSSWLLSLFKKYGHCDEERGNEKSSHWRQMLELLVTLFLGQGNYQKFKNSVERSFIIFWSLSRSVLAFSYAGVLLSILMVPIKEPNIRTLVELRDAVVNGKVHCLAYIGSAQLAVLLSAEDGIIKDFGDDLRRHPENIVTLQEEGLQKLKEGGYALFDLRVVNDILFHKIGAENFFLSNDSLSISPLAMIFKKDFCCIRKFNTIILRIQAAGLYEKWLQDILFRLKLKTVRITDEDQVRPLTLSDVIGSFWILVSGYALSAMILLLERAVCAIKVKKQKSSDNSRFCYCVLFRP